LGDNFDLMIKSNDAFVDQVKFMNSKFSGLDQSAVDAIGFYEKLTPEQKKQFFDIREANTPGATPVPDYQKYIARELVRGYNHYQYHLRALFYEYYKQKTQNLPRGFEGNDGRRTSDKQSSRQMQNDKQFDLQVVASVRPITNMR
jgi:hypothetical protein